MNEERNDPEEWSEEMLAALRREVLEYEPEEAEADERGAEEDASQRGAEVNRAEVNRAEVNRAEEAREEGKPRLTGRRKAQRGKCLVLPKEAAPQTRNGSPQ